MKYIILIFLIYYSVQLAVSQNVKVHISGKIDIAEQGETVQFSKPINRYFNIFYVDSNDNCIIEKNRFSQTIQVAPNSFVRLQSNGLPKFMCYVDAGGEVDFEVITDSITKNQKVIFHGDNAKANELFVNRKLLNDGGDSFNQISGIINHSKNHIQVLDSLDQVLAPYRQLLHDLHTHGEISENCLNDFVAETEQRMLFWTMNSISDGFKNPHKIKMNVKELKKLSEQLFIKFDPFAEKYKASTVVANTAAFKCYLIKDGKIQSSEANYESLWSEYANYFGVVDAQVADYGYAPSQTQEYLIGNAMITAMAFNVMSGDGFLKVFKSYQQKFPNSPYNPVIMESLYQGLNSIQKTEEIKNQFLQIDAQRRLVKYEVTEYEDIETLIKENFAGKMVFVDFWATYCVPCVNEFKHKEKLSEFLKENDIAMLYVSLDDEGSVESWKKFIKDYKLYGFHFLTNKATKKLLNSQFSGIPRYMIYNKDGELVEDDAFRPSSNEELINQLKKLL